MYRDTNHLSISLSWPLSNVDPYHKDPVKIMDGRGYLNFVKCCSVVLCLLCWTISDATTHRQDLSTMPTITCASLMILSVAAIDEPKVHECFFKAFEKNNLDFTVFQQKTAVSYLACGLWCAFVRGCLVFQYQPSTPVCILYRPFRAEYGAPATSNRGSGGRLYTVYGKWRPGNNIQSYYVLLSQILLRHKSLFKLQT